MDHQSFAPMHHNILDVIELMQNIEASEDFDKNSSKVESKNSKKKDFKKSSDKSNGKKHCLIHGPNTSQHNSNDCKMLQTEAKHQKSGNSNASASKPKGKFSNNKTWKCNAIVKTKESKKELNAFVQQAVKDGITKELSKNESKKSQSDDNEDEINALDFNLSGFNYEDMDNLEIDSSDEVSC